VVDRDEHVNLHFVCFVNVNNELYELDGRHPHPIKHSAQGEGGQHFDLLRVSKKHFSFSYIHISFENSPFLEY
jgi:hypothetical protein